MARKTTPLTDQAVKNAKGKDKTYKLFDGLGLYLQITPSGSKAWRFRYRSNGKERTMSFGSYPDITLKAARALRDQHRSKIALGTDPLKEKAEGEEQQRLEEMQRVNTFEKVVLEYLEHKKEIMDIKPLTLFKLKQRFDAECMGKKWNKAEIQSLRDRGIINKVKESRYKQIAKNLDISRVPFADITEEQIREILFNMKKRGASNNAIKFYTQLAKLYVWAKEKKYFPREKMSIMDLISRDTALPKPIKKSYPVIKDEATLGQLLRDIDGCLSEYPVKQALRILPFLAVRPSNLSEMEWKEIDFEKKVWIIPKEKMKTGVSHVVPLTSYVLEILEETKRYSAEYELVFPSHRSKKAISKNTLKSALQKIADGKYEIVAHSFRGICSTHANNALDADNKLMWESRLIESVLAHSLSSEVEKSYNRADYLEARVEFMQWWTDYLLKLKNS